MLLHSNTPALELASYVTPSSWTKETLLSMLMDMKSTDELGFSVYLGKHTTKNMLSRALLSFSYMGLDAVGRKHDGGFAFRVVIDHALLKGLKRKKQTLAHLVIVSLHPHEKGIGMYANIFDGVDPASFDAATED